MSPAEVPTRPVPVLGLALITLGIVAWAEACRWWHRHPAMTRRGWAVNVGWALLIGVGLGLITGYRLAHLVWSYGISPALSYDRARVRGWFARRGLDKAIRRHAQATARAARPVRPVKPIDPRDITEPLILGDPIPVLQPDGSARVEGMR